PERSLRLQRRVKPAAGTEGGQSERSRTNLRVRGRRTVTIGAPFVEGRACLTASDENAPLGLIRVWGGQNRLQACAELAKVRPHLPLHSRRGCLLGVRRPLCGSGVRKNN